MKRFLIGIFLALLLCSVIPVWANDGEIAIADEAWRGRKNNAVIHQAINDLETLIAKEPENYEALWRLARFYQFIGEHAKKKDKFGYYKKGLAHAEQAAKIGDNKPNGHLWFAILMECTAEQIERLYSLIKIKPIYNELQTVLRLDPQNGHAHYVLAQLYWKAPRKPLSIGDRKIALVEAKLATDYSPDRTLYWLIYGLIARDNKDIELARMALNKAMETPLDPEDPYDESNKQKARKVLVKLPK